MSVQTIESGKTNGSQPRQTTRRAQPKPATPATDRKKFWAAVNEAKKVLVEIDERWWRIGELADSVTTIYGEGDLAKFAKEIGLAACTVERHRSVYRAWHPKDADGKSAPGPECLPKSYAVARELEKLDDRVEIVRDNPHITKAAAVAIRQGRKGRKQKQRHDWRGNNAERDFNHLCKLANDSIDVTKFVDGKIEPELEAVLREVIEPGLLPTIRKAGERLIKIANLFEIIARSAGEDAPAKTVSKTKRTSRGKRTSQGEQVQPSA
jgi:hypothetical protein